MPHWLVMGIERVVFVVVAFMRCMAVAVVKIVDMVSVLDGGVATVWAFSCSCCSASYGDQEA